MAGKENEMSREQSANTKKVKKSAGDRSFLIFNTILMIVICIILVYPLYYVIIASFTDPVIVNTGKPLLYPEKVFLGGYKTTFAYTPLWNSYKNTIIYTLVGTAISIAATIPAGYALSRKDMPGRRALIFVFTFTMFFSGGIIPLYLTIRKLGIYNSIWAMVLPVAVSPYNLIVTRSYPKMSMFSFMTTYDFVSRVADDTYVYVPVLDPETIVRDTVYRFHDNKLIPALKLKFSNEGELDDSGVKTIWLSKIWLSENYVFAEYTYKREKYIFCHDFRTGKGVNAKQGIRDDIFRCGTIEIRPLGNGMFYYTHQEEGTEGEKNPDIYIGKFK